MDKNNTPRNYQENEQNFSEGVSVDNSQTQSVGGALKEWRLKMDIWKWAAVFLFTLLLFFQFFDVDVKITPRFGISSLVGAGNNRTKTDQNPATISGSQQDEVLPAKGVVLPVQWGNLGKRMVDTGVIDAQKFESLYSRRGGLDENAKKMLYGEGNGNITINEQNSGFILSMFWAFGLANKNQILEKGPMMDPQYGGAGSFASTGGWSLAKGKAMDHYSKYILVMLTPQQQALVEKVSQNIYRPCCGNSTYFPDCNHGMAMLGLLELLAAQGTTEQQMYKTALQVNSYWFPDTYLTIAKYFQKRGVSWDKVDPKEVLGSSYSSASGYRQILSEVEPATRQGGGGCGI